MRGRWGRAAVLAALVLFVPVLARTVSGRGGARLADLDPATQRRLVETARAYFDPEVEFSFRPRREFVAALDALRESGTDALADIPFLREVVYQGRGFLPPLTDVSWRRENDITFTQHGDYLNVSGEAISLTFVTPRSYPRNLDRIPRHAPFPLLVCLHDAEDAPAESEEPVFPGQAVLKRRYPAGLGRDWLLLAPWAPEGRFLNDDGAIHHAVYTRPLTEFWKREHVDFERIVLDGGEAAAAIAAAQPFVYAGLVLRGGPVDLDVVTNYAHVPVYVLGDPALAEVLEAAGHPDVTRGDGRDLPGWLGQRRRRTPTTFRWTMKHGDQEIANWIRLREFDGRTRVPTLRVRVGDPDDDPNKIRIDAVGVSKIDLYLNDEIVDLDEKIRLVLNGRVRRIRAPGRDLELTFEKGQRVRRNMFFGWLYPALLEELKLPGDDHRERESPPLTAAEARAARIWPAAEIARAEGDLEAARSEYQKIVDLGPTSFRGRAIARITELDGRAPPVPDDPPAVPLPEPGPAPARDLARPEIGTGEEAEEEEPASMTAAEFETWLEGSRLAMFLLILLKYGTAFIGAVLLVIAYRRWDRIRTGREFVAPRPPLVVPFDALQAVGFLLVFFVAGQLVIGAITAGRPDLAKDIVFRMAAASAILLPLALIVILRRTRLLSAGEPQPSQSMRRGLWTFVVACAMVIPAGFLTFALMEALGRTPTVYGPVAEAIEGGKPHLVWWLTVFAVFVAPFTEESVFRGMLYPAVRKLAGGGRQGAWTSAIIVSLLFAAVHYHEASFLPLFALAMVFAWTFEKTDRLAPVIIAHGLWNASSMIPVLVRFSS